MRLQGHGDKTCIAMPVTNAGTVDRSLWFPMGGGGLILPAVIDRIMAVQHADGSQALIAEHRQPQSDQHSADAYMCRDCFLRLH